MILFTLLACTAGEPVAVTDSAEPPPCIPGLGAVEVCVERAERHRVNIYGTDGRQGTTTWVDGPGCTPVYVEPGAWRVEASTDACFAQADVRLRECEVLRVVFSLDDFTCGDRG